jgi:hypothetical protein
VYGGNGRTCAGFGAQKIQRRITEEYKRVLKRDGPKASAAIHGYSGLKFHPLEKANANADYLENLFTLHDLCDENHERRVEATVQALHETVDDSPLGRIRSCDLQKIIKNTEIEEGLRY